MDNLATLFTKIEAGLLEYGSQNLPAKQVKNALWRAPIDSHSQLRDNYLNWSVYENAKKLFKRIQTGRC